MFYIILLSICIIFLLYLSLIDLLNKKISILNLFLLFLICFSIFLFRCKMIGIYNNFKITSFSFAVSVTIFICSICSKEKIGKADAFIFMFLSLVLNWKEEINLIFLSIILSAIFGIIILTIYKINNKTIKDMSIPFIPFITISSLIIILNKLL